MLALFLEIIVIPAFVSYGIVPCVAITLSVSHLAATVKVESHYFPGCKSSK
jgi:hypothetical protein